METTYIGNDIEYLSYRAPSRLPVQALLVSSHPLVLKGICGLLMNESSVRILGQASSDVESMLRIHEMNPRIVIINDDDRGHGDGTIETVRVLTAEFPNIDILMLMYKRDFDKELRALKLSVKGILIENFERETLTNCIKSIVSGGLWCRRKIMEKFITEQLFLNKFKENGSQPLSVPSFTRRELEIIQLAGRGHKNREIGNKLYISEKTVKHHMSKIFKKLNIKKRSQLKGFI